VAGVILIFLGWILTGYAVQDNGDKKYQAGQDIIDSVIFFWLIILIFGLVTQGLYLVSLAAQDASGRNFKLYHYQKLRLARGQ
jgi:hypothetical protein